MRSTKTTKQTNNNQQRSKEKEEFIHIMLAIKMYDFSIQKRIETKKTTKTRKKSVCGEI